MDEFDQLVDAHADAVRAFIFRRASGLDPAVSSVEDITADVWATAWQRFASAPEISNDSACRAWLFQIARFTIANHIRKSVHRREVDRGLRPTEVAAFSAEAIVVADIELQRALEGLTPGERVALALNVWEGLGPQEIAAVTGDSPNAISIRLHRARRKIETTLTERNA